MQREPKVLIRTFNDDEVRTLLSVFDYSTFLSARNKMVLAIAFDTGARNTEIYKANGFDIALVQRLLQHSSAATTQRHIGIEPQRIEEAIQNHAQLI